MVIQYLIDWDSLLVGHGDAEGDVLCRDFMRLSQQIRRNGCLVMTEYSRSRLCALVDKFSGKGMAMVIAHFQMGLNENVLNVDEAVGEKSQSFKDSVSTWRQYVTRAGSYFERGDERCLLVSSPSDQVKGPFYRRVTLQQALDECKISDRWSKLQCIRAEELSTFKSYLQSFSAALKITQGGGGVRIYDPYLSTVFSSVVEHRNGKAWRNSLCFILDILSRNEYVRRIDYITTITRSQQEWLAEDAARHKLLLHEVIDDIIRPTLGHLKEMEVCFHFLEEGRNGRLFHDRFVSNGRFCFSIGHGFDVCVAGDAYEALIVRKRNHGSVSLGEWRNRPAKFIGSDFNVFYGGLSIDLNTADTFYVFDSLKALAKGESPCYPAGFKTRPWHEIAETFDFGTYQKSNEVSIPENCPRVKVKINPLRDGASSHVAASVSLEHEPV